MNNYSGVSAKLAKYTINSHYLKPVMPTKASPMAIDAPKIISNSKNGAHDS